MQLLPRLLAPIALLALAGGTPVQWVPGETEVDVELVLAVDVSRSVSPAELEIQRRGYAEAILSDEVLGAIGAGSLGQIALTYVEWAGEGSQRTVIDWTVIGSRAEAETFAAALTAPVGPTMRRTSISSALTHAAGLFESNGYAGLRQVIDVSGDGPNNAGRPVLEARETVLARGVTINGLPLMTNDGTGGRWTIANLDAYYRDCVIGGPGAFYLPVVGWDQFAEAVRRKLVMELVGRPDPGVIPAQATGGTDCLIGEKIRQQNDERYWLDR